MNSHKTGKEPEWGPQQQPRPVASPMIQWSYQRAGSEATRYVAGARRNLVNALMVLGGAGVGVAAGGAAAPRTLLVCLGAVLSGL
jgi:hypothetical protein